MFSRYAAAARSLAVAAARARATSSATTAATTTTATALSLSAHAHPLSTVANPAIASTIASMQRLHSSTTTTTTTNTSSGGDNNSNNKASSSAKLLLQKKLELVLEIESQLLDLAEHTQEKQDVVYNNIGMTTAGDLEALFKDSHLKRDTISEKVSELKQL
eukprot:CAMPEP_0113476436 /NCGR_PEP_ID=MMETSP0014_2-20120614/19665_1 /TAXON_ID=2857 /ORGANISM="Nitzschia sp." /LENGTH=160 /DNA_ID=CAMNT_0000369447 /DNA_START=30 /DNA_END=508 /DNA_ORIENTATION=- /assembly_acc=CAM_ASM_000159